MNRLPAPLAEGLSPEARRYALWELARRAGVRISDFQQWRIDVRAADTRVFPVPGSSTCIRFAHYPRDYWQAPNGLPSHTARLRWTGPTSASLRRLVPDFIVPFAPPQTETDSPLFHIDRNGTLQCAVDLPAAVFCSLTRLEEVVSPCRDHHGRFPSIASVARREGFLNRPFVDEYGLGFAQALQRLLPGWQRVRPLARSLISQDVDHIGIPFSLAKTMAHTLRRGRPADSFRDLGGWFGANPTWLRSVCDVADEARLRGLPNAAYWKATTHTTPWDTGYDPRDPRIRKTASALRESGTELGVHPGYYTFNDPEKLGKEIAVLRQVLGDGPLGGRQHFLRWSPDTWEHWEQCGLSYDSSVGYSDCVGFRAGTCHPYHPWLIGRNRTARLLEIPLVAMDVALTGFHGSHEDELRTIVADLIERCRLVGGVMTLLWHNSGHTDPRTWRICTHALDLLSGHANLADYHECIPASA